MKQTVKYSVALRANPMNAEEAKKAYGVLQTSGVLGLDDLAAHIHDHNTVFSKGVILGVLTDMSHCVREALIEGNVVNLGDLGTFRPSISTTGVSDGTDPDTGATIPATERFTAANIDAYNINFTKGPALEISVQDVDFEFTTSRKAQAAAKAAARAGETSADWSEPEEDSNAGGGSSNP